MGTEEDHAVHYANETFLPLPALHNIWELEILVKEACSVLFNVQLLLLQRPLQCCDGANSLLTRFEDLMDRAEWRTI